MLHVMDRIWPTLRNVLCPVYSRCMAKLCLSSQLKRHVVAQIFGVVCVLAQIRPCMVWLIFRGGCTGISYMVGNIVKLTLQSGRRRSGNSSQSLTQIVRGTVLEMWLSYRRVAAMIIFLVVVWFPRALVARLVDSRAKTRAI